MKIGVDLGAEKRTLVAGLGAHYQPGDLLGLQVVVVTNLEPTKIRGIESEGMMLGVGCSDRNDIAILTLNKEAPNGSTVE